MASVKWSITLSPELAEALSRLATARGDSRSALIETLLREHAYVQKFVDEVRQDDELAPAADDDQRADQDVDATVWAGIGLKKGRSPEKLRTSTEAAREAWLRAEAQGKVRYTRENADQAPPHDAEE